MSAGSTHGIGPVSVRYAAQIRELLYTQAVQKAAAEQEAVRQADAAEKAARFQPAVDETPALKIDADTSASSDANSEAGQSPAEASPTPGELVDLHA
jgi:hypothetical protein